ncbi:MAG: hydroxyacid dehydrogenase [Betaproteobacteria bacterium]|nr:hydroxyacid dehydrogenase [Betaproteobacteria bacterium]
MHRPRAVVTNRAFTQTLDLLSPHCDLHANHGDEPWPRPELLRRAADAHGLLAFMPDCIDEAFLEHCAGLKVIACALKGYDNFDIAACTRRGIWVSIVPDLLTEPTAELAVGLAIGLGRHVAGSDRRAREGTFAGWRPTFYGRSLDGSCVAIIGAGRVGRAIARKLAGFDCELLMVDASSSAPAPSNARYAELAEALSRAQFVFLAVPLDAGTLHMVDAAWLTSLRPGALLVNPARGSVVVESAIADALRDGQLGGYAADVFECEDWARADRPEGIEPRLLAMPQQTLFTTHIGSAVREVRAAIEYDAAVNLLEGLRGERPHGAINDPVRRRP